MRAIAGRLTDLDSYREEFLAAAQRALAAGRTIPAAYHLRSVEFFMCHDDPRKVPTRERFLQLIRQGHGIGDDQRHLVAHEGGDRTWMLPAYRLTADRGFGLAHAISDPRVTNLIGNVLIFFVLLFSPIIVPITQFPSWLAARPERREPALEQRQCHAAPAELLDGPDEQCDGQCWQQVVPGGRTGTGSCQGP
jgi:hypothetical protein